MPEYQTLILIAMTVAPWAMMPTPAIIAACREGLSASGKPLMLWALLIGVVFTAISFFGIMISPAFLMPMASTILAAVFFLTVGAALKIAHL